MARSHQLTIATVALVLLLTGCSGGTTSTSSGSEENAQTPTSEQSKADACAIVKSSFEEFTTVSADVDATDPQAAIDSFKALSTKTTDALGSITNAEVKPAATKAATALDDYVAFLETVMSDPSKASDVATQSSGLQEGFTEVATICAG